MSSNYYNHNYLKRKGDIKKLQPYSTKKLNNYEKIVGLKYTMMHVEITVYIVKLNSKQKSCSLASVTTVMHTFCWSWSRFSSRKYKQKNNQVTFRHCTLFSDYISEINNAKADNGKDLHVVIPMYNLTTIIMKKQHIYGSTTKIIQIIT